MLSLEERALENCFAALKKGHTDKSSLLVFEYSEDMTPGTTAMPFDSLRQKPEAEDAAQKRRESPGTLIRLLSG